MDKIKIINARYVSKGVRLLDKVKPGWFRKVKLTELNITSPRHCILYQVFGDYSTALYELGTKVYAHPSNYGFCGNETPDEALTEEWKRVIQQRRAKIRKRKAELVSCTIAE